MNALSGILRRKLRPVLAAAFILFGLALPASAQTYTPPATHRVDRLLNAGWRFIRQDVSGAQNVGFDDSTWSNVDLPHTWNNLDGQDGGNNYYRGSGWYRLHYVVDSSYAGRRFFLKFGGAFLVADVYVNGSLLGEHQGGFAAFVFDATPYLNIGADNVIAVKVSNAANADIPPLSADFTFFGGLYREVHLLVTDPVQISPLDYGSPGVYLRPTSVSSSAANLQVTTVVSNATAAPVTVMVRAVITDAATNVVTALTNLVRLPSAAVSNVVANTTVAHPHLWNGLYDPYLYQAFIEVWNGPSVVDVVAQPLGFRSFSIDPDNGFFLNGQPYDLHGVDMHQDWLNCGWALTNAQRLTNFLFLKEIGATAVRLSHYQHHDETYQLADQNGLILWSEVPNINLITSSSAYYANTLQQLQEMIRQQYNHPAVVCWGLFNEITLSGGPDPSPLVSQEAQLAAQEDPTRPTTAAANSSDNAPTTLYSQLIAFNKYYGWYGGSLSDFAPWADNFHRTYPTRSVGVSEYGSGASIYQHSEDPVSEPANAGPYHPEEYQNLFHESYWQQMKTRPFLWGKFIWNLFDFASDGRNEGDTAGRNDKGLVTYDRQVRKDAFYWYKANWTTNPMVYITGHTFTNRQTNALTAKVYANCDAVELFLNGVSQGVATSANCIFTWPLRLLGGPNTVTAIGTKGAARVSDSLTWSVPVLPPGAAITDPATSTVYLNSTNSLLPLTATATDNQPSSPPPLVTSWVQLSGPGTVTFGDAHALSTTARFSSNGVYNLAFQATKGTLTTSVGLTVVVGKVAYGPALQVRVPFDDADPGTTTPSDPSGGGVEVTLQMLNKNAAATNLHGAVTSGVAGRTNPNRALDLSSNPSQGGSGSVAAVTNSALGFGNVTNFVVTLWFKQSVGLPGNIGPRLFVLGNSTNTDCGTPNCIGMKFQVANQLYCFVNTLQATATFAYLPTNQWVFVAMVYDGANVMLYEGTEQTPATLISTTSAAGQTVPLSSALASLFIGNRLGRDRDFAGWIDDFRFYAGAGDWSFVESVRQAAAGPVGVVAVPGNNQVLLSWSPLLGAASYNVKRSLSSGGPYATISPPGTVTGTTYTDFTATNGMTCYYVVSAATSLSPAPETANSPTEASALVGCSSVPAPAVGYNSPMYAGMTLCLSAATIPGATCTWTGPNGFSATNQNPCLVNAGENASGLYSVIATVAGCASPAATTQVTIHPPARLSFQSSTAGLVFSWPCGALQSATNPTGPWTELGGVPSPYTNALVAPRQFFRVRLQ